MTTIDRRTLLRSGVAAALVGGPFAGYVNSANGAAVPRGAARTGLHPARDKRDGRVRLHLPRGFQYRSFHDTTTPVTLADGTALPGRHDGMGAFAGPGGSCYLVRNHEVNGAPGAFGPVEPYDSAAGGGTSSVRVTGTGRVLDSWTSLSGTMMNCSGGIMPWGTWVTCEETVNGPDVGPDFTGAPNIGLQRPHGYVFEVPVPRHAGRAVSAARPITAAGRFAHEAVSFDPEGGALYLTEDNFAFASGFYRYTPRGNPMRTRRLDNEGTLEMLAVKGRPNAHLEGHHERGTTFEVEWVPIPDPDPAYDYTPGQPAPTSNDTALTHVSRQGWARGAAYFSRLEGQVYDDGVVFFTSTQGGGAPEEGAQDSTGYGNGRGQVWAYDTRAERLTLVFESPGPETLDFPDNVTARNGALVLCEDGGEDNYVRALSADGKLSNIAWNRLNLDDGDPANDRGDDEFAGSTFSPDGRTLFVNIQASRGLTFAIWGPWHRLLT
jgi:uncharacterized protein